jgi:hypothetical protein
VPLIIRRLRTSDDGTCSRLAHHNGDRDGARHRRGPAAGYFPFRIGVLIVLGSIANLARAFWRGRDNSAVFLTREQAKRVLAFGLPLLAFVVVSWWLGLYVATILYLFGTMVFQGGYRPLFSLAVALGVAVAMRLVFPIWFKVPLLTGPFEAMLGLY